jgi:hypothetical protein
MQAFGLGVHSDALPTYKEQLIASEIVDWMTAQLWATSRERAVQLGQVSRAAMTCVGQKAHFSHDWCLQMLVTAGYLEPVAHSELFRDEPVVFRFGSAAKPLDDGQAGPDGSISPSAGESSGSSTPSVQEFGTESCVIEALCHRDYSTID